MNYIEYTYLYIIELVLKICEIIKFITHQIHLYYQIAKYYILFKYFTNNTNPYKKTTNCNKHILNKIHNMNNKIKHKTNHNLNHNHNHNKFLDIKKVGIHFENNRKFKTIIQVDSYDMINIIICCIENEKHNFLPINFDKYITKILVKKKNGQYENIIQNINMYIMYKDEWIITISDIIELETDIELDNIEDIHIIYIHKDDYDEREIKLNYELCKNEDIYYFDKMVKLHNK